MLSDELTVSKIKDSLPGGHGVRRLHLKEHFLATKPLAAQTGCLPEKCSRGVAGRPTKPEIFIFVPSPQPISLLGILSDVLSSCCPGKLQLEYQRTTMQCPL